MEVFLKKPIGETSDIIYIYMHTYVIYIYIIDR